MALGPWSINPAWQNFSSLFREARSAEEAPTDMERSHHLTAALYFGIATLEAFLNREMRSHLKNSKSEEEIFGLLRKGRFMTKLKKWPTEIIGSQPEFPQHQQELLELCNDVRGDLTHPKTMGHDIYERLLAVQPEALVEAVATYMVTFHVAHGTRYPYWVFGWNYLNPSPGTHETILINDQQFCFSLQALGFDVPAADWGRAETWKERYFKSLDGYRAIKDALGGAQGCEPKHDRFPFQPKLCRRWWTPDHHKTCGHVSSESLAAAKRLDGA
jgi:hypothetical protein